MASRSRSTSEARPKQRTTRAGQNKEPKGQQAVHAQPNTEIPPERVADFQLDGSIRVILTWNLVERAFLVTDDSRRMFPLLRGTGSFAMFVRSLSARLAASTYFCVDADNGDSYRADLISQYAAEYEFNPTFRIREDKGPRDFLPEMQRNFSVTSEPTARAALELKSIDAFTAAWWAWPIKRFRISRYGFLQVILETNPHGKFEADPYAFVNPMEFLAPIKALHEPIHLTDPSGGRDWDGLPEFAMATQWGIVGSLLSRIIEVIENTNTRDDLLRFDPYYRFGWREKQAFVAGTSLPLRTEYTILGIRKITLSGRPIEATGLTSEARMLMASLLAEVPRVRSDDPVARRTSPHRPETIRRILESDEANLDGEMFLLSTTSALITTLLNTNRSSPSEPDYEQSWKTVRRVIEYFTELRLLASLVERKSADLYEYIMRDLSTTGRLLSTTEFSHSNAALSSLANRLRVAASADSIATNESILPTVQRLRAIFEIGRSLENADRNLLVSQNLITSAESQQNEFRIQFLTVVLGGLTAILMGLALPTFFEHSRHLGEHVELLGFLRQIPIDRLVFSWANFSVFLIAVTFLASTRYVLNLLRVGHRIRELFKKVWL